jgi:hypothetical protein
MYILPSPRGTGKQDNPSCVPYIHVKEGLADCQLHHYIPRSSLNIQDPIQRNSNPLELLTTLALLSSPIPNSMPVSYVSSDAEVRRDQFYLMNSRNNGLKLATNSYGSMDSELGNIHATVVRNDDGTRSVPCITAHWSDMSSGGKLVHRTSAERDTRSISSPMWAPDGKSGGLVMLINPHKVLDPSVVAEWGVRDGEEVWMADTALVSKKIDYSQSD